MLWRCAIAVTTFFLTTVLCLELMRTAVRKAYQLFYRELYNVKIHSYERVPLTRLVPGYCSAPLPGNIGFCLFLSGILMQIAKTAAIVFQ